MTDIILPNSSPGNIWIPGARGRQAVTDHNEINLEDSETENKAKLEYHIAKQIGVRLEREYPGREWGVRPDLTGGVVEIFCFALSRDHNGDVIGGDHA